MSTDKQEPRTATTDTAEPSSSPALIRLIVLTAIVFLAIGCRDMDFTCDSAHYIDAARFLAEEYTYATEYLTLQAPQVPSALSYWPPLYSAALAVPLAFGLSPNAAAWIVAVIGYGSGLYLLVYWLKKPEWVLLGTVCYIYIIFSFGVAFRALSEAAYIPLLIGALVYSAQAVARGKEGPQRGVAIIAGVVTGLAMLSRYTGFALLPAIGVMAIVSVVLDKDIRQRRETAINAGLTLVIALCIIGAWLLRDYGMTELLFGPERPPREYPISGILLGYGTAFYQEFVPFLIAFLFAAVGFHRLQQTNDGLRFSISSPLTIGSIAYAIFATALTVGVHFSVQIDQPVAARLLIPTYMGILLAGLALISSMTVPRHVLTRRWYIVLPVALPILLAPVFAATTSNPSQPPTSEIDQWVQSRTSPDDLLIGKRVWPVRFNTGRPVLDQTFVADPSVYDGEKVARFLQRFGGEFNRIYLLAPKKDDPLQIRASYRRAGLDTERVATVTTEFHRPGVTEQVEMMIYRVILFRQDFR